jgi:hypothetical protein
MLAVSYDKVVSTLCLCDVVAYIKAREGRVVFPKEYAGRAGGGSCGLPRGEACC